MATSFTVNKHDLEFILKQIKISEDHASGTELTEAIRKVYGVDAEDAALLPAGLRTVDGTLNNLLPGRADYGAAQTEFPRLLDPTYVNDTDGDSIDFDGPFGPSPALTGGNYGAIDSNGNVGTGNVVDADPRTISNLIVTQDVSNPAAIRAALKAVGVEGTDQTAAANAITSAYKATLNANGANAEVQAAQADLEAASAVQGAATFTLAAINESIVRLDAGLVAARDAQPLILQAQFTAGLLNQALRAIPTTVPVPPEEFTESAPVFAEPGNPTPDEQAAYDAWVLRSQAYEAELAAFNADPATIAYNDAMAAAQEAYDTALAAAQAADDAADLVQSTLGANNNAAADGLATLTENLVAELTVLDDDGLSRDDLSAAVSARQAFVGGGSAQTTEAYLSSVATITAIEGDKDAAAAAQADAQADVDAATADLNAAQAVYNAAVAEADTAGTPEETAAFLAQLLEDNGLEVGEDGGLVIENLSPDIGLSPSFNTFMTIFGQFFDHGLDLVNKGGNGTVYIPLEADDPLIAGADKVFGTADDLPEQLRFMTLTRATPTFDADGTAQHTNSTTPWVDQNQTYTSHASHQVFLREHVRMDVGDGMKTYSTGHLLDGKTANGSIDGAIANWGEVKAQALEMLGIRLQDHDAHRVPLLLTDQYGNLILGENGYAQMVMAPDAAHNNQSWLKEGTAQGITTDGSLASGVAFLVDIAHTAVPTDLLDENGNVRMVDHDRNPGTPEVPATAIPEDGDNRPDTQVAMNNRGQIIEYDGELLDAHYVSGDGRGNENIGLTAVHSIFHSEHNRIIEENKKTILASGDRAFINEWLLVDLGANDPIPTDPAAVVWDGARLFQAGRFSTEMQYQHMVFEEFARRIQPFIDPFVFTNTADIDASIVAEFAHTVYRFGHSMLNGSVDRLDNELQPTGGDEQVSLIEAFLNPIEYLDGGADFEEIQGALVRGMSRDVGNEIDEFVVPALQSNLLGLPLDLAAINIARGRETGVPSLQETRAQLYNDFGLADLKPYESWNDFVQNIKNPLSIINFIAAYGTHETIEAAETLEAKRDAATLLVLGDTDLDGDGVAETAPGDRMAFLNGTGTYAGNKGGLDHVDLWIGGLAERLNEFGGMLGSTFNFIFEYQMESLQNGDRFYYLSRVQGLNLLNSLEQNTFSDIAMRNSDLGDKYATHLNGHLFVTPDLILELDRGIAQEDYNPNSSSLDPVWEDPLLQSINPKVVRDYTNSTKVDGNHDFGGELRFRGGEHVVIGGTEGNDRLYGDLGIDTIWGDGGDDYINAGQESDEVFGGDGDDIIEDPFGDNFLRGNAGNDVISSARGFTLAFGNEGDDAIFLGQDAAEAFGDEGDDFILGSTGPDLLQGGEGDDWIEGGEGFDIISGENSELFFNSTIIGHDVAWGQGNDQDYDLESGDDIAFSGIGVQRFEGMFGFDWSTAKYDVAGVDHDMAIPFFTTDQQQILRDRFDQMEGMSGWKFDDKLSGDDRGQTLGGVGPGAEAEARFADHILTQEGIDRIDGLAEWMDGARLTLFGSVAGAEVSSFRDGNILMGGDGSDTIMGRGGFDLIDGDAWLNVRIGITIADGPNAGQYSAESLNSDRAMAGPQAGKVFAVNADGTIATEPSFGGRSLTSLLLDRTINPGEMHIIREIKYDQTPGDIDTAVYRGTRAEYDIEGDGVFVDFNEDGDFNDAGEDVAQVAWDINGDGFISVTDRDDGATGAIVGGVQLQSRRQDTDDMDLLKNIERLQFSDETVDLTPGANERATGVVEIIDDTPLNGQVTPFIGQVLTANLVSFADLDGVPTDANGLPVGLTFEWQSLFGGNQTWLTVHTGQDYTVREADIEGALRVVAVFDDANGLSERIYSAETATPTAPFSVDENAGVGTVVATQVPPFPGEGQPQFHMINPDSNAGGRFDIVQGGQDVLGNPLFQLVVSGGPMDYETQDEFQIVDNQYQIVIDTYDIDPALGGVLLEQREFTVFLNDVVNEVAVSDIMAFAADMPATNAAPSAGDVMGQLTAAVEGTFTLGAGSSSVFALSEDGVLSVAAGQRFGPDSSHVLNVELLTADGPFLETFTVRVGHNRVANEMIGTSLDDTMYGLADNDTLIGGAGDDNLFGNNHNDRLFGETGNDRLGGGRGDDTVNGGDGDDTIIWTIGDGRDITDGGAGTDTMEVYGTDRDERLFLSFDGTNLVVQDAVFSADDVTNVELYTVDMGAGIDRLDYRGSSVGVTVDLVAGTASGLASVAGVENVVGTAFDDVFTDNGAANLFAGLQGDDIFIASVDDVRDEFRAGGGFDLADYSAYSTDLTVDLAPGNDVVRGTGTTDATSDILVGFFNFIGGSGNDTILGRNNVNDLQGGEGDDILDGGRSADLLTGGAGNDIFRIADVIDSRGVNTDSVLDFELGSDLIDVSALANGSTFVFLGAAPRFDLGTQNQIRVANDGGDALVMFDNDGDRGIEAQIRLVGVDADSLTETNFMLG